MNDKKILFFDIDGTLLTPHPFKVPESTSRALTKAHENGHLLFINTGRTKVMMPSALSELHFDGGSDSPDSHCSAAAKVPARSFLLDPGSPVKI